MATHEHVTPEEQAEIDEHLDWLRENHDQCVVAREWAEHEALAIEAWVATHARCPWYCASEAGQTCDCGLERIRKEILGEA